MATARTARPDAGSGSAAAAQVADDPAAALAHVRAVVARSGTSFFWAMRLLPRPRREAMFAIYAFCREVDDIADGDGAPAAKLEALAAWRAELDRLYAGLPAGLPTARALAGPIAAFGLRHEDFAAIIDGMEMDATGPIVAPPLAELELYCARVAGAVGLLSLRAFGANEPHAPAVAHALGQALQLTNILRDLREDALTGRLYLPRELLAAHAIRRARDPEAVLSHPALPAVCADLAALAHRRFDEAAAAIGRCERRPLRPAIMMMAVYRRLLDRMTRRGWSDPAAPPPTLSRAEKVWIALRHGLL